MAYAAATFPDVTAFNGPDFAFGDFRRAILRTLVIGLGAVTAVAAMAGLVTVAAAWMIAAFFATNPDLQARAPTALETVALAKPYRRLAGAANALGSAPVLAQAADARNLMREAELTVAAAPISAAPPTSAAAPFSASAPGGTPQLPPKRTGEPANRIPLPPPRPPEREQIQAKHEIVQPPSAPDAPEVTASIPPPPAPTSRFLQEPVARQQPHDDSLSRPDPDSRTAVYDIEAHTVYLPNGERLEAHSGLGRMLDDPRYVNEKGRGATPPNVYDLALRRQLFHGVQAIRLNPVDDSNMFGRGGILAHSYMLGPNGQSFGCVSFRDYPEFLRAFLRGDIGRLVVVRHLETGPADAARARREHPNGRPSTFNNGRA